MADAEQRRLVREALRAKKRAEALRANLKRRRAQVKSTQTEPQTSGPARLDEPQGDR